MAPMLSEGQALLFFATATFQVARAHARAIQVFSLKDPPLLAGILNALAAVRIPVPSGRNVLHFVRPPAATFAAQSNSPLNVELAGQREGFMRNQGPPIEHEIANGPSKGSGDPSERSGKLGGARNNKLAWGFGLHNSFEISFASGARQM